MNNIVKFKHLKHCLLLVGIFTILFSGSSAIIIQNSGEAYAFGRSCCRCGSRSTCSPRVASCSQSSCECQSAQDTPITTQHITDEFILHREWLIKVMWEAHLLPAMMLMTEQISTVAMQQMLAVGTFFDAKHQLETQRLLQDLQAQAHKDYHPSEGMCQFGTNTRSLAASDRNSDFTTIALSSRNLQRNLLGQDGISAGGSRDLRRSRLDQFRKNYCARGDFGNGFMTKLCKNESTHRTNRDITFTSTIDRAKTLNLDFSDNVATEDEADVLALSMNLYGHDIMPRIPEDKMATKDGVPIPAGAQAYMMTRSLAAQRSVAQTAFAAQAALRAQGTDNVQPYMRAILIEMGVEPEDVDNVIGDRPSYHSQMELLTKTLYQNPKFYTDLYDKPTNIDRKIVAMEAIGLMQRRDMYRSQNRSAAIESLILETSLDDLEKDYSNIRRETETDNPVLDIPALQ